MLITRTSERKGNLEQFKREFKQELKEIKEKSREAQAQEKINQRKQQIAKAPYEDTREETTRYLIEQEIKQLKKDIKGEGENIVIITLDNGEDIIAYNLNKKQARILAINKVRKYSNRGIRSSRIE